MKRRSPKPNNTCCRSWPASTIWFFSQKQPDSTRLRVRFMEREPLSLFRRHWDHEPDNAVGARLCEPQRVATAPSPAGHRRALRDGRFMESPDAIFSAHWDDEPVLCKSLLCSPTVFRFMGSLRNCSHMSDAKLHRTRPCPRLLDASGEGDRRRGAGWFMNRGDGDETV